MKNPLHKLLSKDLQIGRGVRAEREKRLSKLERLSKAMRTSACQSCALHAERGTYSPVPGEGRGRILFVGHRIGRQEAYTCRPAIGPASQYGFRLFVEALCPGAPMTDAEAREYALDYAYVSNAARCGHEDTTSVHKGHWTRCAQLWLQQEMRLVDPVIVVFWNKNAAEALLGGKAPDAGTIGTGTLFGQSYPVMVMTHPVAIAREPTYDEIVRGQFTTLGLWLHDQGLLSRRPASGEVLEQPEHLLVTDEEGLEAMLEDLWDREWVALDTETRMMADYGRLTDEEVATGALRWYAEGFDLVTVQLAGLEDDGTVRRTYTVAVGFRDELTGRPQFKLKTRVAMRYLDELLRHAPVVEGEETHRFVCLWGAHFDCPVLTRYGLDLLGFTHQDYPIQIIDGMLMEARLNEHLGQLGQLSLDAAAKRYLQEGKGGSFTAHFDPMRFPYSNMSDPAVRQAVLDYTGGDPQKTLLVTMAVLKRLSEHADQVETTPLRSSVPTLGFSPMPYVNLHHSQSRLRDVAMPIDHQMIPIVAEMEMVGFKLDMQALPRVEAYVQHTSRQLAERIHAVYPWFKPQSTKDLLTVLRDQFDLLAAQLTAAITAVPEAARQVLAAFGVDEGALQQSGGVVYGEHLLAAYEQAYGQLTAQQSTVEEKLFVYLESALAQAKRRLEAAGYAALLFDTEPLKRFTSLVFIYKQLNKKWATYFERFAELAAADGIIHPSYKLAHTVSGRFSGNFHNIPRGGEEDQEWVGRLLEALGLELPEDKAEREALIAAHNKLDVRQYITVLQPEDLNPLFERMNLISPDGKTWRVREDDEMVLVTADFAAQEDRNAYAQTGDETKGRLLGMPKVDTHFYNVSYCFGGQAGFDTSTHEGVMAAYEHFTHTEELEEIAAQKKRLKEAGKEKGPEMDALLRREAPLKNDLKKNKAQYRTPMKTVHYASQYGAGEAKLHMLLAPVFAKIGQAWTFEQTKQLKAGYDRLYSRVTELREQIMRRLDERPYIEYPLFGAIRHAKVDVQKGRVVQSEYLSVANAYNQGTCAYITKLAMLRMRHAIWANAERWNLVQVGGDTYVGLVLQVHDEVAVVCPARIAHEVAEVLEAAMKIAVGPPLGEEPFYDDEIADARGQTGWLYLGDEAFRGKVLFDAEAEIKRTIAKARVLADGSSNIYASTPEEIASFAGRYEGRTGIDEAIPLVVTQKDRCPWVI